MNRIDVIKYVSIIVAAMFIVELVIPMLQNTSALVAPVKQEDVVQAKYTGIVKFSGIREEVLVLNPDDNLTAELKQLRKDSKVLFYSNSSEGLSVLFRNTESVKEFIDSLPETYSVQVSAVMEISNGSIFKSGLQEIRINTSFYYMLRQVDRNSLDSEADYDVTAYVSKSSGEILQMVSADPVIMTDYSEIELRVLEPKLLLLKDIGNITSSLSEQNLTFRNDRGQIAVLLNASNIDLAAVLVGQYNRTFDVMIDYEYKGYISQVLLKDLDSIPLSNQTKSMNATVSRVGKTIVDVTV